MISRLLEQLYRRCFPAAARRADLVRAARLREANRRMQESAEKRQRQEDAARYLDRNIRHLDDAPRWDIER